MKVAIVGGGAAGFFAAFSVKEHHPESQVIIFEKSDKLLSKVKISVVDDVMLPMLVFM